MTVSDDNIVKLPFYPPDNHPTVDDVIATLHRARPDKIVVAFETDKNMYLISNDLSNQSVIWLLDRAKFMSHSK